MIYKPRTTPAEYERRWRAESGLDLILWAELLDPGSMEHRTGRTDANGDPLSFSAKRFGLWIQRPVEAGKGWVQFRLLCPRGFTNRASTLAGAFSLRERRISRTKDIGRWHIQQTHAPFMLHWLRHAASDFADAVVGAVVGTEFPAEAPRSCITSVSAAERAVADLGVEGQRRYCDPKVTDYAAFINEGAEDLWLPFRSAGEFPHRPGGRSPHDLAQEAQAEADRRLLGHRPDDQEIAAWKLRLDKI